MVRNSNSIPTDRQLVEWYVSNGPGTKKRRRGRPSLTEEAAAWFMEQFNPLTIRAAFRGIKLADDRSDKQWGVYRIIRELIEIAGDNSTDDRGKLRVTPNARLQAMKSLREYHNLLACIDDDYLEGTGRRPLEPMGQIETDPIVLSLRRDSPN